MTEYAVKIEAKDLNQFYSIWVEVRAVDASQALEMAKDNCSLCNLPEYTAQVFKRVDLTV